VSDRDPIFTKVFWKELFNQVGVKLMLSSVFHPQTNGQSEVVNQTIAMYLNAWQVIVHAPGLSSYRGQNFVTTPIR
jgi:hypothetical protein